MTWEEFKGKRGIQPLLTIYSNRRARLSVATRRALGDPTHVLILWDREKRVIGIRRADGSEPYHFRVLKPDATVAFARFMDFSGIVVSKGQSLTLRGSEYGSGDELTLAFPLGKDGA